MSGFLSGLEESKNVAADTDVLGGNNGIVNTGLFDFTIDMAYFDTAKSGAKSINFVFKNIEGTMLRNTVYMTSGTAKGTKTTYMDKSGVERNLPGFSLVNDICLLSTGKPLFEQDTDNKVLKLYDFESRKETPQTKEVVMSLLAQEITLGVKKVIEDLKVKDAKGKYVIGPEGYTRTINDISKAFRTSDHMTAPEVREEAKQALFYDLWKEKNGNNTVDKSSAKLGEVIKPKDATKGEPGSINQMAEQKVLTATAPLFGKTD